MTTTSIDTFRLYYPDGTSTSTAQTSIGAPWAQVTPMPGSAVHLTPTNQAWNHPGVTWGRNGGTLSNGQSGATFGYYSFFKLGSTGSTVGMTGWDMYYQAVNCTGNCNCDCNCACADCGACSDGGDCTACTAE